MPDQIVVNGMAKWPISKATWNITALVPGLSLSDQKEAYQMALASIEAVCNFKFEYHANGKNLLWEAKPLGGPQGVLGQTWLPINATSDQSSITVEMDRAERWVVADMPGPSEIDIVRVACHEACHWMGLPHGGNDLMKPTYDIRWRKPGPWSIVELVKRYGEPVGAPPPPTEIVLRKGEKLVVRAA